MLWAGWYVLLIVIPTSLALLLLKEGIRQVLLRAKLARRRGRHRVIL